MERVAEENAADIRSAVSLEVVRAAMGDGDGVETLVQKSR